jgi:hypothetical protein
MKLADSKLGRSVVAVLLLFAAAWSLNISASSWWIAGFHGQYWHDYASRGNRFFVLVLLVAGGFVFMVVPIFRMKSRE